MTAKAGTIEAPQLKLSSCSIEEHCRALQETKQLPFWWYQGTSRLFGNFSLPFQDACGNWWYQVKPGLCWAVDCFAPIPAAQARPASCKSFLGYQHVVPDEEPSNSHLVINAFLDLSQYGPDAVNSKRRNSVRKGFRQCALEVLKEPDAATLEQCRAAWRDLTERTGWKHAVEEADFHRSWRLLLDVPGTSIIVGRDNKSGQVAGFLVTKIIGTTAYVDTIASRTEMLGTNVNDAVMYAFLTAAREIPGVDSAHYAIKSTVKPLERFKIGLGFSPVPFPARTHLRGPVGLILRALFADKYHRMTGQFEDEGDAE